MIINIRGTNGSGKTTLARAFQTGGREIALTKYHKQLKRTVELRTVTGVYADIPGLGTVISVGSYRQAQGGLDTIPSFALQFAAIEAAAEKADHVICEGILASTVAGSWVEFFKDKDAAICYLDTPVEVCLQRIKERQERAGKVRDIKEDLVRDKFKAIAATRPKFVAAGIRTFPLFHQEAETQLHRIMGEDA